MTRPDRFPYGRPKRVEGGLRAQSTKGAIGESWWSKRFITILESFAGLGGRLGRGRTYARAGQVLELHLEPGLVRSRVQGSRDTPYDVGIGLAVYGHPTWARIEQAMASQALFLARLLAGEMPQQIEEAFTTAQAPLFPARPDELSMSCSCPDPTRPCKHIAATLYLLAESFDADPFEILHWRGRDRATLLANLRALRGSAAPRRKRDRKEPVRTGIGAVATLADMASPDLGESVGRFWVPPVPLPARPPTLVSDVDLLLQALPTPDASLGGPSLTDALRALYLTLTGASELAAGPSGPPG